MQKTIRPRTVKLIGRFLIPLADEGVIFESERKEIMANLKSLAENGTLIPPILPKLIDQREAAEMLGISHANFKKMEREGAFTFKRKMVGSSVRFRNTEIMEFIMARDE